jgi:CTP synthase (UTP-ammonia lyase)
VLRIREAGFEETDPAASIPFISKLSCSLVGEKQTVTIFPDTLSFQAYGKESIVEQFSCNYGLNEGYRDKLARGELKIIGVDTNGDVRIVELSTHRFFVATLFLPQLSSSPDIPHPLIMAYMKAALAFRDLHNTENS